MFCSINFSAIFIESSYSGSFAPTCKTVLGHFLGNFRSPFSPPTNSSVMNKGLANGLYCCSLSTPIYYRMQSRSIDGYNNGAVNVWIFEGENFVCRSQAGYAAYIPYGRGRLFFMMRAVVEKVKFPPAESPAMMIFLGEMLKYLSMWLIKNL